jgi:hypothetical protein
VGTADAITRRGGAIGKGGAAALLLLAVLALLPAAAMNGGGRLPVSAPEQALAAVDAPCGGQPLPNPDRVITGAFGPNVEGSYVMLPFQVPAGTDAVRVKYCHDQPLLASAPGADRLTNHTLDMGLYGPRPSAGALWGRDEFRGWGGSSRKDVTLSPEGSIDPNPNPVATEETTVGYRPGPIDPGEWAVELGVAEIGPETPAVEDGQVQWRVEIDLIDDPAFSDEPYESVPYDETPASSQPGWYAGDFHVHARHSNPGDATMRETFDYAFAPLGTGAGLDFITLSDYVSDRAWGEIGAFQDDYPGKLIVRSSEVITYRGHLNNHGSEKFVDYRTGPIFERRPDGALVQLRAGRPASEILKEIDEGGGWNQLNHVRIFPSQVPTFDSFCRGCPWDYSDAETDYSSVDAIEVATGPAGLELGPIDPGPNPFTPLAILFYEHALDAGGLNSNHIAAVGSSDSHNAGSPDDPLLQAPIGTATTVVRADELSEQGIGDGVRAGHTYVKMWGGDGPDLRFEATAPGLSEPAVMGDTVVAGAATLTARVLNQNRARAARAGVYTLFITRNGLPFLALPMLTGDTFEFSFPAAGPARYGLQVQRIGVGASVEAYSTPIWIDPNGGPGGPPDPPDPPNPPEPPTGAGEGCSQTIRLTRGDDAFAGTEGSDRVRGRGGDDRLRGAGANDCLGGGRGDDRVRGDAGRDRLRGGSGDDRIRAVDGARDLVRCGAGTADRVRADTADRLRGCEIVRGPSGR